MLIWLFRLADDCLGASKVLCVVSRDLPSRTRKKIPNEVVNPSQGQFFLFLNCLLTGG